MVTRTVTPAGPQTSSARTFVPGTERGIILANSAAKRWGGRRAGVQERRGREHRPG